MSLVWAEGIFLSHFSKTPTRPRAKRSNREAQIQRAIVHHLELRADPDCVWTASANGGKRDAISGRMLQLSGVRAGWPDLEFFMRGECFFLEVKSEDGRLSPKQVEVHAQLKKQGFAVYTAYGLDDALLALELRGFLKTGRVQDVVWRTGGESPSVGRREENGGRNGEGFGGHTECDHRSLPQEQNPAHFRQIPPTDGSADSQTQT